MKLDPRYKVTAEIVLEILNLRARGCSFKNIANKFNISVSTAWYWSSADYRQKQREKNKKRMALTISDLEKAKKYAKIRYYKKSKDDHLRDRIRRSLNENNYVVRGKKRSYWLRNFPHLFEARPKAKLDGLL